MSKGPRKFVQTKLQFKIKAIEPVSQTSESRHVILWDRIKSIPIRFSVPIVDMPSVEHIPTEFHSSEDVIKMIPKSSFALEILIRSNETHYCQLISRIARLARELPYLLPYSVPLLKQGRDMAISMSQRQVRLVIHLVIA